MMWSVKVEESFKQEFIKKEYCYLSCSVSKVDIMKLNFF